MEVCTIKHWAAQTWDTVGHLGRDREQLFFTPQYFAKWLSCKCTFGVVCDMQHAIYIIKSLTVSQLPKALLTSGAEQKMSMSFSVQLSSQVWSSVLWDKSCISSIHLPKHQSSTQLALYAHIYRESWFRQILFRNIWSEQQAGNWMSHINQ